jgi:hypothetical protein
VSARVTRRRRRRGQCSLCGKDFNPSCQWCLGRAERLRPLSSSEAVAYAEEERRQGAEAAATAAARRARLDRLFALGRPVRVGLVGCAKRKRDGTHAARELYTSPLFRLALRVAEGTCDEVFVLSAVHELVDLAQPIASYDRRLSQLDKQLRALWGTRVSATLADRFPQLDVELHLYAGREYLLPLHLPSHWRVLEPLRGLGIGDRLRRLSTRARELAQPELALEASRAAP